MKKNLMLERSIALGIDEGVRLHAARICDIEREEMAVEFELSELVSDPQFLPVLVFVAEFKLCYFLRFIRLKITLLPTANLK